MREVERIPVKGYTLMKVRGKRTTRFPSLTV